MPVAAPPRRHLALPYPDQGAVMPSVPRLAVRHRGRSQVVALVITALALLTGYAVVVATSATAASTLLSQGRPATASSIENAGTPAAAAVDGNTGGRWTTIYSTTTGTGGTQTLDVSGTGRYIRVYGTARATPYGYSLWEFQVYGTLGGAGCGTANAALNRPTSASSTENAGTPASAAVDGNAGTRWSSAFSDPQWLQVDLGSGTTVCQVVLQWETAYARAFQIQVSDDATAWTTIYSTTTGTGGMQTLDVSGTGRYLRMYGTARATGWGYSLWELVVHSG